MANAAVDKAGLDQVGKWLAQAGLQKYAEHFSFSGIDELAFRGLLMQDYGRYGVTQMEDKQRLFRLIKMVNSDMDPAPEPQLSSTSSSRSQSGLDSFLSTDHGLLDIHAMDDDEMLHVHEPMDAPLGFASPPHQTLRQTDGRSAADSRGGTALWPCNGLPTMSPPMVRGGQQLSSQASFTGASPRRGSSPPTVAQGLFDAKESRLVNNNLARIRVVVRKRPINKKEIARKEEDIVIVDTSCSSLIIHEPKVKVDLTAYLEKHEFTFDAALGENTSNDEVYKLTVEPLVGSIFNKGKATCFAYGQTGSGKTYTMSPLPTRAAADMFRLMAQPEFLDCALWLSYFEIYGGKVFDLLNERRKLCMREDGKQQVCIVGLKEYRISTVEDVRLFLERGNLGRSTGVTGANEESSRSHAILQLALKRHKDADWSRAGKLVGKFSFIDLAGSERGADTYDNDKQTRLEGAEINKSLLALKECIRALDHDQGHIPFRGSKLTEVLRDSFVGDSRTVMIANISPNAGSCEHTLNTLRYADRVKGLSKSQRGSYNERALQQPPAPQPAPPPDPQPAAGQQEGQWDTPGEVPPPSRGVFLFPMSARWEDAANSASVPASRESGLALQSVSSDGAVVGADGGTGTGRPSREEAGEAAVLPHQASSSQRSSSRRWDSNPESGAQGALATAPTAPLPPLDRTFPRSRRETEEDVAGPGDVRRESGSGEDGGDGAGPGRRRRSSTQDTQGNGSGRLVRSKDPKTSSGPESATIKGSDGGDARPNATNGVQRRRSSSPDDVQLTSAHEELLTAILEEEEEVISLHRQQLEDEMQMVRQEMKILADVDQPSSSIDSYVTQLSSLLTRKISMIHDLQSRLVSFQDHLREEEALSKSANLAKRR